MGIKRNVLDRVKRKVYNTNVQSEKWLTKKASQIDMPEIYGNREYLTNIKSQIKATAVTSRRKEIVIEKILDKGNYTFQDSLFIVNPFRISLLSGLLIFNTQQPCKVEYTVKGKRGTDDFTKCDETLTTRHRVPVLGMYEEAFNKISVRLIAEDGHVIDDTKIIIKMPGLKKPINGCVEMTKSNGNLSSEFILASGGYHGGVYAFDKCGNIRFALARIPQYYGVYLFKDGKFLFPEMSMRRPAYGNAHTTVTHEMDMLGRVYHTYYDLKGYHHWAIEKEPGGNILTLTSSMDDTYMENSIVEIDRKTGEVVRELSANELFDDKYKTRNDWAHINSIDYIPEDDAVIASMRNIHTIAKISLAKREIVWLMTKPSFYKGTEQADKVLKPVGDVKWYFQQHGVSIIHDDIDGDPNNLHITLFDNHTANRRPVKYFDKEKQSNAMVFTIDEKAGTFKQEKYFTTPLSVTRSNNEYVAKSNTMLVMCANLKPEVDGYKAKIFEFDYSTGEVLNEISCKTDFFAAHQVDFNIPSMSVPLDQKSSPFLGQLYGPEKLDKLPDDMAAADMMTEEVAGALKFRTMGDVLQINALDHDLEKIYLYNDKNVYLEDYTDTTQPLKVFKTQSYYVNMHMKDMPEGLYNLGVQYLSKSYKTEYWVEITK